jgi:hypothetical protein
MPKLVQLLSSPDFWKSAATAATGVAVGGLAVWSALTGKYIVNLTVELDLKRTPNTKRGDHDLVFTAKLKKGSNATLAVERMDVQVDKGTPPPETKQIDAVHIDLGRSLNVPPGEQTQFAQHFAVPSDAVCEVQLTIQGRRYRAIPFLKWLLPAPPGRWRATAISVPYLDSNEAKKLAAAEEGLGLLESKDDQPDFTLIRPSLR